MSIPGRILIVGAAGQLGRELQRTFSGAGELICLDRNILELADENRVRETVRSLAPDVILNAAAYTAVDRAESEPHVAAAINTQAPRILAEEAQRRNALLIHYSTDYVFDGSKLGPWLETDQTNPLSVYGATKLAGEDAVREVGGRFLIFRTSWVYGPHGSNFLLTMLRLGRERDTLNIVDDQVGAPTTSLELATATRTIVDGVCEVGFGSPERWAGIYHMTCAGSTSWCGFARQIFARGHALLPGRSPEIHPIPSSQYPTPATRPKNSVLSNQKLASNFRVELSLWQNSLEEVLEQLKRAQIS